MLDACDVLVAVVYVVAIATVLFGIHIRCKADVTDIERHCLRQGSISWWTFRATSVVVLVGGAMHGRLLARFLADHGITRIRAALTRSCSKL